MNGKGRDCILRGVAAGLLDADRADRLVREIDRIEAENFDALGPIGARKMANADALAQAGYEAAMRRRDVAMQLLAQDDVARALDAAQARGGLADQSSLVRGLVDSTGMKELGYMGAQQHMKRVRSAAHRLMADVLQTFHALPFGVARNKAKMVNMLKEIFGEETGDVAAREMATAWKDAAEMLRRMYNQAGGAIARLESWNLPQTHNTVKLRQSSFEQWRDAVVPLLKREAMLDRATGKPLGDAQLDQVLKQVHETLRTAGWDGVEPSGRAQGMPLARRHQDSRVLHFRNAESWLAYAESFGDGDPFSAMMRHIDAMSREIGAMRALGPNPRATIRFVQQRLQVAAHAGTSDAAINAARSKGQFLDTLYSHYIGDAAAPVNGRWARGFSSLRQYLTSAQLGSAALSALSDVGFQRITAKFNGLSHVKVMARQLSLLNPANAADRKLAVRLGLIAEEWSTIAAGQMRYTGEVLSSPVAARMADGVLRLSGLQAWTQAGRWAFGMEFMGHLADHTERAFADLPELLQAAFKRYDITPEDWEVMRATPHHEPDKGGFLRPDDLLSRADLDPAQADAIATRFLAMVQSETEFAVPSSSIIGKATIMGDARPGSFAGEFMRSAFMYKNFGVTLFHTHIMRGAMEAGAWNKLRYFSSLAVSTTLMGALALQMKQIRSGKDPVPMADSKFWAAALVQGGGFGIFGDFLFAGSDRFGHSKLMAAAGPVAGFASDAWDLTGGNAIDAVKGDGVKVGRDAVQFAGRYTPGSSLWYARYAVERGVLDTLQRWLDPGAEKSWKSRRAAAGNEQGADYWSPPGGGLVPQRGPDWANALRNHDEGKVVAQARRAGLAVDGQSMADLLAGIATARKAKASGFDVTGMTPAGAETALQAWRARRKAERAAARAAAKPPKPPRAAGGKGALKQPRPRKARHKKDLPAGLTVPGGPDLTNQPGRS